MRCYEGVATLRRLKLRESAKKSELERGEEKGGNGARRGDCSGGVTRLKWDLGHGRELVCCKGD